MADTRRIIIGLIIEDLDTDFSRETIQSALRAIPSRRDIQLVVMAGKHDESQDIEDNEHLYKTVYNSVYEVEEMISFDGLIVSLGERGSSLDSLFHDQRLVNFHRVPKVYVAASKERKPSVNYDNETGIREALDYLINVNGCSHLCMLGGREDNSDAVERKEAFIRGLEQNHVHFTDSLFEATDMSSHSREAARRLLHRNPDVQAIFCVNDAVAEGLYEAMNQRNLVPGRDILVFGFDNTRSGAEMFPTLASVGSAGGRMGQIAMDMILRMIEGEEVESVVLPTKLYGKESFRYDVTDFTLSELARGKEDFILRIFDECFYRYQDEESHHEAINLKRLFYEIVSRMVRAARMRYMSSEESAELRRMIEVFFKNNAMDYTDANKFIDNIGRFQNMLNKTQRSMAAATTINRLFLHMKDMALLSLAQQNVLEKRRSSAGRKRVLEFLIEASDDNLNRDQMKDKIVRCFDMLGFMNAALLLFPEPIEYDMISYPEIPDNLELRCVMKKGVLFVVPEERRDCPIGRLFGREELSGFGRGYVVFPIFYSRQMYGYMVSGLVQNDAGRGEYICGQIGKALYCARDN